MASIKAPRSAGPPEVKKLKVGSKSLKLSIYETFDSYIIYIGGHELYCIEAMVYKPTSPFITELGYPLHVGKLVQIYYNMNCSLENNFQRGIDTNNILKVLCEFIRNRFKYITELTFTDASSRTCDNGQDVELAEMSYMRTGYTWYEKKYGAYLHEDSYIPFKKMQDRLEKARALSWNDFKHYIPNIGYVKEFDLKSLYESTSSWQDFFGPLSDKIGISNFCNFVAPWMHSFFHSVTNTSFSSFNYVLPINRVPTIEYDEMNYVRGGRKFTRKQKQRPRNYQ
jgi:hypothetical protein